MKPALVVAEPVQDARHAAEAIGDLTEKLSRRGRPEAAEVFGAALQTEPDEGIEVDHDAGLSARAIAPKNRSG